MFVKGMNGLPLYVIEAAFGNQPFQLFGDHIQHVRCKDLIWQQYTLINKIVHELPEQYDQVVWVDADIIFTENWYEKMAELLTKYKVVQSYKTIDLSNGNVGSDVRESVTYIALENAKKPTATTLSSNLDLSSKYASGFSWGVQRDVIEKFRIYDYWITGSCDSAFVIGIWGDWKNQFFDRLNPEMKQHYFEWAKPFHDYIDGSVSYLNVHVNHLWHGYRNYKKRWNCLKNLNPYNDLRISNGVLEWSSDKPDLHECCKKMCLKYEIDFKLFL